MHMKIWLLNKLSTQTEMNSEEIWYENDSDCRVDTDDNQPFSNGRRGLKLSFSRIKKGRKINY